MTSDRKAPAEVHSISGAPEAHSDDLERRMRRYLFSMAIRTACVVLAVVVSGPLRWIFIVGAVILPYVAVVMANAVGGKRTRPAGVPPVPRNVLTGTVHSPGAPDHSSPHGPDDPFDQHDSFDVRHSAGPADRARPDSREQSA